MEMDLKQVTIKEYSNGKRQPNVWFALVDNLTYVRPRKIGGNNKREKERFFIGSTNVFKSYGEAVTVFKRRVTTGTMENGHGFLKWDGLKFYMDYKESKEIYKPTTSAELEKLDTYKANLKKEKESNDPVYLATLRKSLQEAKEKELIAEFKKIDTSKAKIGKVIADPICEEVMSLINKTVEGSNSYCFNESVVGKLIDSKTSDEKAFKVEVNGTIVACSFIRSYEKRIEPYALANPEVRRSLFGRLYKTKDGQVECCVNLFTSVGGWKINGMSATRFLTDCVWLDTGEPCGDC